MALSTKQQLRTVQSLSLTPQLLQAIRLLQMSSVEIAAHVETELTANPLLQRAHGEPVRPPERTEATNGDFTSAIAATPGAGPGLAPGTVISETVPAPKSLHDRLAAQVELEFADHTDRIVAWHIIGALDSCGYLDTDTAALAADLGVTAETVAAVLERCRRFEPAGLFARDLADCLALQLDHLNRLDPAMRVFVDNLDLLAAREFDELRGLCGVDEEDFRGMVAEIRSLDPKPGLAGDGEAALARIPDILVRPGADGGWHVELNAHALPKVLVDREYHAHVTQRMRRDADRQYMSECLQQATWLKRSLDQRARTILAVAVEIVSQQAGFLEKGVAALRPMNLRMIARKVGMHESTVSRAVANKCMATPRGVLDLKSFFSTGLASTGGGVDHAAEAVKHRIHTLIDAESPDAILSDDALVTLLRKDKIGIARRTVAKYRESLGIGSSVERRREKRGAFAS